MKQRLTTLCVALITLTIAQVGSAIASEQPGVQLLDQIIAVANDGAITQTQVDRIYHRATIQAADRGQLIPNPSALKQQILDKLIAEELISQIAISNHIAIAQTQVNEAIRRIAQSRHISIAELKQKLAADDYTYAEFRGTVSKELLLNTLGHKALDNNIHITADETNALMKKYRDKAQYAAQYHLLDLVVPLSAENATKAELDSAQSKASSLLNSLKKGTDIKQLKGIKVNDLGWKIAADLPDLFTSHLNTMHKGSFSGPIAAKNGYHLIQLLDLKQGSKPLPTKKQIQQLLEQKKFAQALNDWVKQLRKESYVNILIPQ